MKNSINSVELYVYFILWILANFGAIYNLYKSQTEIFNNNPRLYTQLKSLTPGWSSVGRLKDISDVEWTSWKYFFQTSWFYLVVQAIGSEIVRNHSVSYLKPWYIFSSALFVILGMGVKHFLVIISEPILYGAVLYFGGGKITIWIISIVLLSSYNSLKYQDYFWNFLDHENLKDEEVYLLLFCIAWVELRCISFCLDYIDSNKKVNDIPTSHDMLNLFSYVLYAPLLYTGPVLLYENFENSFIVENKRISEKLKSFLIDIFLFLLYSFLLDLSYHYIYFYAMQDNMQAMRKFTTLDLIGGGLWMGLQFHMKYVIAYGITTAFARLDNMNPPPTPRCIARIHVYSQMWRYFDVGLYKFLVKYIYKPSFDKLSHLQIDVSHTAHKLMAAFGTFAFIYFWHGTIKRIFVWTMLNYLGITFESIVKAIASTDSYASFKANVLKTDAMETRLIAVLCVPGLMLSGLSNYYLFSGDEVGNLFLERVWHASFYSTLIIWSALYCCCQCSIALKNVASRTDIGPHRASQIRPPPSIESYTHQELVK